MSISLAALKDLLVVSCQADPGDPLEIIDALRGIASASVRGGPGGLRLNGAECIAVIRPDTVFLIIRLKKAYFNGQLRITPNFTASIELGQAGEDIIALDCTDDACVLAIPGTMAQAELHPQEVSACWCWL